MKMSPARFVLFLCIALLVVPLSGCREEAEGSKGAVEEKATSVLAMIGDEQITRQDLEVALERMQVPAGKREALRNKVLDNLIEATVFAGEARRAGLENDPEVMKAVERTTNETLARYFVKNYIDREAEPSEEELEAVYVKHRDQFIVPEGVLIQHIVVKEEPKARELLEALKAGASFETLAKEKSLCRCFQREGLHGWVYKGKMNTELEKLVFNLEKGVLSDVIKTEQGYEIVKVKDRRDQREIPLEEAKPRIRYRLLLKKKKELINQYYERAGVNTQPDEPGVLLKIGDEAITEETLAPILAKFPEKDREEGKARWIRYLKETKVFSKEARKVELEKDPEVMTELKRKTNRILAKAFRERFMKDKFKVGDEEIEEFYQSHLEEFRVPEKLRAKSILVKTREEAENILKDLKQGAVFSALAVKKSLYPLASRRGGEIGWFAKGEKDPALEKAAFSMKIGQVSDIIKTEAGYEIIKLMDRQGGGIKPLDEVKEGIERALMIRKSEGEKQRYYKKAGVKILAS
jgi:EpsD family peptidyl-prolyl cis-trans isomerase